MEVGSLLQQLEAEAMDLSVPVVSLLMKMKALATKLDLHDYWSCAWLILTNCGR